MRNIYYSNFKFVQLGTIVSKVEIVLMVVMFKWSNQLETLDLLKIDFHLTTFDLSYV